ncbi:MAG: hypothetical protein MZV64_60860 [Ignavibacteriales bacterium]|nr:hypothetical protein [Ignavibacteriales bacterium]
MAEKKVEVAGIMGPIWAIGWLFTLWFFKACILERFSGNIALALLPGRAFQQIYSLIK